MTTQSDQIEEILKAENKARKHIEETISNLRKEEIQYRNALEEEIENKKQNLQERRNQKMEIFEQEAAHIIDTKKAEAEGSKNSLISAAKSKQGDGVNIIVTKFVEHIKA